MKKKNFVPIVFVEYARKPSRYLINNLTILQQKFPDRPVVLILSEKYLRRFKNLTVEIITEESIPVNKLHFDFEAIQKNWSGLQKSYWTNTTKRFFVLNRYMEAKNLERIIHLESDCVLLNDSWLNQEFENVNWGLKYPKQHNLKGCASVLLINKRSVLNNFLSFILSNWDQTDITDMDLLAQFVNLDPNAMFLPSGDNLNKDSKHIYDGVSIGKYFMGTDARNQRLPFSTRGINEFLPGALSVESSSIRLNSKAVLIYEERGNVSFELNNLHVHSKRIPRNYSTLERRLLRESNKKKGKIWKLGAFDHLVFTERSVSFLVRRTLLRSGFEFRLR
jgi:hypothetical protein